MRAGVIHLARRFIGDKTGLFLKKYAVSRQHREAFEGVVHMVNVQRNVLTRSYRDGFSRIAQQQSARDKQAWMPLNGCKIAS